MSFRPSDVTKGGQITAYRLKMFNQVNNWFSFWTFTLLIGAALLAFVLTTPSEIISNGLTYWIARSSESFLGLVVNSTAKTFSYAIYRGDVKVTEIPLSLADVIRSQIMKEVGETFLLRLELFAGTGAALAFIVYIIMMFGVARIGKKETADEYISGMTRTDNPRVVNKLLSANRSRSPIKIGPLHLVKDSEIQNILLQGTIGTGKSTIIRYLLDYIRRRGDKFIIFDPGNTFIKTHYDARHDFILDPHDARCANWDLWHECQTVMDYENFASSLIPVEGNSDPFWVSSSRTICADTAMKMSRQENPTIEAFLHTLLSLSLKSLRGFLENTPSSNLVEEKIEKTAISIRSVTTNYAKALRFMQGVNQGQPKFSIREWMQDKRHSHSGLFISTRYLRSTRSLISMWLSMATSLLQTMGEDRNRRVWFIIDETPSLQKIPGFREILADARKYGGCFVLGIQNMAQMSDTYGDKNAKAILDLLNTRIYGRSPSSEMATEVEKELGYQRRWEAKEQNSFGLDQIRDGVSIGRDKVHVPIVDYEEIMRLPDLSFFFRLPGEYPVLKMEVPYRELPAKAESFIERRFHDSLSPLLEKIIQHNETATGADFIETAPADETAQAEPKREVAQQAALNAYAPSPAAVAAAVATAQAAAAEDGVTEAPATATAETATSDNVTDIFTRTREKTRQAERIKPAAVEPAAHAEPAEQPELEPDAPPAASPEVTAPPVHASIETAPAQSPIKMKLKKLNTESDSESGSQEQSHSPVVFEDEGKLIVKDESEIGPDGRAVKAMAEEEKNILVHRQSVTDSHEEPEL